MEKTVAGRYIERLEHLPTAPTVSTELLVLFGDPDNNIDRVVELIRHAPSLTAKILKRLSRSFGSAEPSTDIFEIITRVGFYEVYCVVAADVAASMMALGRSQGGVDLDSLWRHSVATAVAAGVLARRIDESDATAFTAGLLHDIGKLVFASVEGPRYAEAVKRVQAAGSSLGEAEAAQFGTDHAAVGGLLLLRWGLPANIAIAVRCHNAAPGSAKPFAKLAAIVQVASDLANQLAHPDAHAPCFPPSHAEALNLLGLTGEDFPQLLLEIHEGLERVEGMSTLSFDAAIQRQVGTVFPARTPNRTNPARAHSGAVRRWRRRAMLASMRSR